jgi:hypothetical protein
VLQYPGLPSNSVFRSLPELLDLLVPMFWLSWSPRNMSRLCTVLYGHHHMTQPETECLQLLRLKRLIFLNMELKLSAFHPILVEMISGSINQLFISSGSHLQQSSIALGRSTSILAFKVLRSSTSREHTIC